MEKHIMLLFLSDVKTKTDNGKRVISSTEYEGVGRSDTTNESAVRYLLNPACSGETIHLDKMFVFTTKMVKDKIRYRVSKDEEKVFVDEDGHSWTHLEYFENRLKEVLPEIVMPGWLETIDYDENSSMAETKNSIVGMARAILDYYKKCYDENNHQAISLVIHADLTGGMRNANMMMLAVLRLLQYNDFRIDKLLYSDFKRHQVEEAKDIYGLFSLIAGADEFTKFGSISAILEYFQYDKETDRFGKPLSLELQKLLYAMWSFSDEIKLCHYGSFRESIRELRIALHDFSEKMDNHDERLDFDDLLMGQVLMRIIGDYRPIMQAEEDAENGKSTSFDLILMRWCLARDYLQQTITLFTERVPEYLFESRILRFPEEPNQDFEQDYWKNRNNRSKNFYVLMEYKNQMPKSGALDKVQNKYFNAAGEHARAVLLHPDPDWKDSAWENSLSRWEAGSMTIQNPDQYQATFGVLRRWAEAQDFVGTAEKDPLYHRLVSEYHKAFLGKYTEEQWMKNYVEASPQKKKKRLAQYLADAKKELKQELFSKLDWNPEAKLQKEQVDLQMELIHRHIIECSIPDDRIEKILLYYDRIRQERNNTNHARIEKNRGMVGVIKQELEQGIRLLSEQAKI